MKWQRFKNRFKKLWYFLIGREWKIGWKMTGPHVVIFNDNILNITIDKRK